MPQQPAPSDEIIPAAPASVIHELKYKDLLLLKTLAETESLTKTSARIGISVAKASRMLSSLRKLFNNELVQRCGPRMIATPELERLLPDIRASIKSLGKLFEHPLAFHPADIESRLVFACTDNAYLALLAPALKRLAEEAPRLQISVSELDDQTLSKLSSGDIDFILGQDFLARKNDRFRHQRLLTCPHCVVVRRDHPMALAHPDGRITAGDLRGFRQVLPIIHRPSGFESPTRLSMNLATAEAIRLPYFIAGFFTILQNDCFLAAPLAVAQRLSNWLPIELLHFDEGSQFLWTPEILWHERTDASPLHQWVRSIICSAAAATNTP